MHQLTDFRKPVYQVAFSPDGDLLAGLGQKNLWCWTRSRRWELGSLQHPTRMTAFAFHPAGRTIAYCGFPAERGFFGREPEPERIRAERARPTDVRFHPLCPSGAVTPDRLALDPVHLANRLVLPFLSSLAFSPDGGTLLGHLTPDTPDSPRFLVYWHVAPDGAAWRVADPAPRRVETNCGAVLVGQQCLALVGSWGVHVCPLAADAEGKLYTPDLNRSSPVAASPVGELVATASDGELRVWHLRGWEPVTRMAVRPRTADALAFAPDGRTLAVGWRDGAVEFFDPAGRRVGAAFDFGVGRVAAMAYAPDGMTLAVAGANGLVVVDVG